MKRLVSVIMMICLALALVPAGAECIDCSYSVEFDAEKYQGAEPGSPYIIEPGTTAIYGFVTEVGLGYVGEYAATAMTLYFNGGAVNDGKGHSIPLKVYDKALANEPTTGELWCWIYFKEPDLVWINAVIEQEDYDAAEPGVYEGELGYRVVFDARSSGGAAETAGTGTIPVRLVKPGDPEPETPEAYSDSSGDYAITGGEAVYQKPAKDAASAKIPDTITLNGKVVPVTRIADNAFKNNKKLTKVTIGKNIKEIGKNAFMNCVKLKTVSGGANLEIIGDSAFAGCKALTKFTIGAKVNKIGKKAFNKCAALKKITIKSKLLTAKTVGSGAFKGINASATIKVPKAVKKEYTKWLLKKGVKKTMKIK